MTGKFFKFLLALGVVNTGLFYFANSQQIPIWVVLSIEVLLYGAWIMVKAWFDPAQQLVRQGAHMGWVAAGTMIDEEGWRDTLLRRNETVVRVSYKEKALYIVEPTPDGPYRSFVELERFLTVFG